MRIEKVRLQDLKPADYNPRKISGPEFEKLKRSIEEFGYVDLIIKNERTGAIVGGHQRYKALDELGYDEIDIAVVDLDETKEKALNIALNKISGDWDIEKLKDILLELDTGEVDVELTGFDLSEIEEMMTKTYQDLNDNDEINLDDFDDENFDYCCPNCDFHFNSK
jgi:ParB-like chromosome segregation protein Spo0J